jgi:hypothetical protein
VISRTALPQLPASEQLSPDDTKGVRTEIARLEQLARTEPDKCGPINEIARTWAYAGQYPEVIGALKNVLDLNAGFDVARDSVFAKSRGVPEFEALAARAREATPPVLTSRIAFKVAAGDLVPENLAFDPKRREFYFGSTLKHKIVRCSPAGGCRPFVRENQDGLATVLGLKLVLLPHTLWVVSNSSGESGFFTTIFLRAA